MNQVGELGQIYPYLQYLKCKLSELNTDQLQFIAEYFEAYLEIISLWIQFPPRHFKPMSHRVRQTTSSLSKFELNNERTTSELPMFSTRA